MVDSGRTLVQRTLFTGPHPRVVDGMYVESVSQRSVAPRDRVPGPATDRRNARSRLTLAPGASATTNTYFGRFAASFWQRYADLPSVRIEFDYEVAAVDDPLGGAELRLDVWASDITGRHRPLDTRHIDGHGHADIDIPLSRFVDGGAIWFDVAAIAASVTISDVRWTVPAPRRDRPSAVVICTHNRPEDCIDTITMLASDPVAMERISSVYVVDQGDRRVADSTRFAAVSDLLGDKLHYLTQPNLGGAGGFTRGIYELSPGGICDTDIVVMDDDIVCEPESILRIIAFANNTVQPVLVGAQMLLLSETYRLHMGGEWEALDDIKAGDLTAYAKSGMNLLTKQQDPRSDAGWNGWWSCLLPAEAVTELGLSLPLFFQWDDIEFGIRARHAGYPTVTLPHAGVWHADFHLKDYDDWSRYFSWRNGLIVSALHGGFDGTVIARTVAEQTGRLIVAMQYGLAETFLLAIRDFLAGPSVLSDGGQSTLAALRALRAHYPDTVVRSAAEAAAQADPNTKIAEHDTEPDKTKLTRVLVKRAVQQYLGKVSGAPVFISADSGRWWFVSLFDNAIVTDASQTGVRIRRRDSAIAKRQAKELAALCWRLRAEAPDIQRRWRAAVPELTSRENWERLFSGE